MVVSRWQSKPWVWMKPSKEKMEGEEKMVLEPQPKGYCLGAAGSEPAELRQRGREVVREDVSCHR